MVFLLYRLKSKDCKINGDRNWQVDDKLIWYKIDPGAIGFTSGFSQDSINITVGEQVTVEQLIEKCIVIRISRHDHVYKHHVRDK